MATSFNFFALTKFAGKAPSAPASSKKRRRPDQSAPGSSSSSTSSKRHKKKRNRRDPSSKYLPNPLKCPIVDEFKSFFSSICTTHRIPAARVHIGPHTGWRTVAKLSVRAPRKGPKNGAPVVGIFAPGSHNVIELLHSSAHHPAINAAIKQVSESAARVGVVGYNGKDHGGLSYVAASVDITTGRVQLVLVFNAAGVQEVGQSLLEKLIDDLTTRHSKWHSIWSHFNKASKHDNAIFGREGSTWKLLHGESEPVTATLSLRSCSLSPAPMLRFPPQVFRQANLEGFTQIIREIRKWMNPQGNENGRAGKCVELYGGVGTIGLNVLDLVEELWCSDANPFNEKCFTQSRDALSPSDAARASYSTGGAADMALAGELAGPVDVLIVDPPRKGLDEEVLEKLISGEADPPLRILYVSCGFKAFGRDYQRLSSRYKVVHAEGHVLFPGSNHIETLCVFDRKDFVGTGRSHEMPTAMRSSSNSLSAGASSNSHQSSQYDTADRMLFSNNSKNLNTQETMRKKLKKKKSKKKKRRRN